MFSLFDDFLQQPLTVLQIGDFRFVVGQRPSQAEPFVPKGGASGVWHHHRAQLLLVELDHKNKIKALETGERERKRQIQRDVLLLSSFDANCVPEHKGSRLVLVSLEMLAGASSHWWSGTGRWRAADLYGILQNQALKPNPDAQIKS